MIKVPDDFPRDVAPAGLAGAQPKLAARMINGRFVVGLTEEERLERWQICEDLAQQLIVPARKDANSPSQVIAAKRIAEGRFNPLIASGGDHVLFHLEPFAGDSENAVRVCDAGCRRYSNRRFFRCPVKYSGNDLFGSNTTIIGHILI